MTPRCIHKDFWDIPQPGILWMFYDKSFNAGWKFWDLLM